MLLYLWTQQKFCTVRDKAICTTAGVHEGVDMTEDDIDKALCGLCINLTLID